jgi:hypothetical protein
MDPRPPSGLSNHKGYPSEPSVTPTMNFHPPPTVSTPSVIFTTIIYHDFQYGKKKYIYIYHDFPPTTISAATPILTAYVQYVIQPQYASLSLPRPPTPSSEVVNTTTTGAMPIPAPQIPPPPATVVLFVSVSESVTPHSVTGLDEQGISSVDRQECWT